MAALVLPRRQPGLPAELIELTVDALDRSSLTGTDMLNLLCASRLLFDAAHRKLYEDLLITQRNTSHLLAQISAAKLAAAGPGRTNPFARTRQLIVRSLPSDLETSSEPMEPAAVDLFPQLQTIKLHPEALIALAEHESVRKEPHPLQRALDSAGASGRRLDLLEIHLPPNLRRVARGPVFCCGPPMGHWIYTGSALPCPGCRRERISDADLLGPVARLVQAWHVDKIRIIDATTHDLGGFDGPGARTTEVAFRPCRCVADPDFWDECDNHMNVEKRLGQVVKAVATNDSRREHGEARRWRFRGAEQLEQLKGDKGESIALLRDKLLDHLGAETMSHLVIE